MSDQSTTVLQGYLERATSGDVAARQRLLELTRDRLMRHARRHLHGRHARLEPFEQTDDVVQQLYVKILQNQEQLCDVLDTCLAVSRYLLENAEGWLGDTAL